MNIAQAYEANYEANFYWRCKCGYENNSFWYYEGESSYNFTCDGCGEKTKVLPPPENAEGAQTQPTTANVAIALLNDMIKVWNTHGVIHKDSWYYERANTVISQQVTI